MTIMRNVIVSNFILKLSLTEVQNEQDLCQISSNCDEYI